MNRGKKLLLLCGALVVLGAGYAAARTLNAQPAGEEGVALTAPSDAARLEWTSDGVTLALVKEEDSWRYADDDAFPLDQTVPEDMTSALSGLTASLVLEDPAELADYGLDAPDLTITATDGDGTDYTFAIGDQNKVTQEYYLLYNGDESRVYLVDSTLRDAFSLDLYDMVEMETLPAFGTVTGLTITQPGGSLTLSYVEDNENLTYDSDLHWFLEEDGAQMALDTGNVSALTAAVTGLTWMSCVNYDADDQELAAWGLEEDAATQVVLTYTSAAEEDDSGTEAQTETFTLLLGEDTDNGTYARLAGSRMIYLINSDTADSLRYASYASLRGSAICTVDWDTVDRLTVTVNGADYAISFDEQEVETVADGGDPVFDTEPLYTCDGAELDSTAVEELLSAVHSLSATGDGGQQGELLIRFTMERNTETFSQLTLDLYACDTSSCVAVLDGGAGRLVERSAVNALMDQLEDLFAAE